MQFESVSCFTFELISSNNHSNEVYKFCSTPTISKFSTSNMHDPSLNNSFLSCLKLKQFTNDYIVTKKGGNTPA